MILKSLKISGESCCGGLGFGKKTENGKKRLKDDERSCDIDVPTASPSHGRQTERVEAAEDQTNRNVTFDENATSGSLPHSALYSRSGRMPHGLGRK